jgi:hypothetical protein
VFLRRSAKSHRGVHLQRSRHNWSQVHRLEGRPRSTRPSGVPDLPPFL